MRESLIGLIPAIKKSFNKMRSNEPAGYVFKAGLIIGVVVMTFTAIIYLVMIIIMALATPQNPASPKFDMQNLPAPDIEISFLSSAHAETDLTAPIDPIVIPTNLDDGIQNPPDIPIPPESAPTETPVDPYEIFDEDIPASPDGQWQPGVDPLQPDPVYSPSATPRDWAVQTLPENFPVENIFSSATGLVIALLTVLLMLLISYYYTLLTIKTAANIGDSEYLRMGDLLKYPFKKLGSMLVLMILMMLIYSLGFLLLIIPGIIFMTMFMFAPIILVKENVGAIEALKRSKALTSGYRFNLFLKGIGFTLLMILCFIPMVIFMYATMMIGSFAFNVFIYEVLYTLYLDLKRIKSTEIELNTPPAVPVEPQAESARTETASLSGSPGDAFTPNPIPSPAIRPEPGVVSLVG
ncbi:hypothetical protein A2982_03115 [candidate division WWE3 bacterium RIFCSPLOWO2_01_FULL_39_13]|uniref:Glycerophosphoryl diester phosphodiesterase membrane domain-containing protein n=1 Tax=candidate division WWE3 bacterium RIFCSPLOWO2_01_FULL_39_13 TaxID=1802624 RepID=A0A1F4V1U3_UNCKA|nr:MAG: hypothetical protein A2982_03115 [candidate division WWE3 bacterium RIFCSPLOWO2_01_FULL_39_13]